MRWLLLLAVISAAVLVVFACGSDLSGPAVKIFDQRLLPFRAGLALGTLVVLVCGAVLRAFERPRQWMRERRLVLGVIAVLAFLINFHFFLWLLPHGFQIHDTFHYYMGSKYFPELGYFGLYECSLAATLPDPRGLEPGRVVIRDLRTNRLRPAEQLLPEGDRCGEAFTPERWQSFRADVGWFKSKLGPRAWRGILVDIGYNPSPVWTLIGRPISSVLPTGDLSMRLLTRLDLVLVVGTLVAAGWAFGFEGLILVAIVWGLNPLSRYVWVGDSFLRQAWFASSMIGLCCLKRGRHGLAGGLLTLSALLRVFPACFLVGYALYALRRWRREGSLGTECKRFAAASLLTGLVLLLAAGWVSGRGVGAYGEFAGNIGGFSQLTAWNSVGLRPALSFTERSPEPTLVEGKPEVTQKNIQALKVETFRSRIHWYLVLALVALGLFFRASARIRDWEAAALGFALIPILAQPPSYYLSLVTAGAFLATRRPRLAIGLSLALVAWCSVAMQYHYHRMQFVWASIIATLLCLYVLLEMGLPLRVEAPRAPTRDPS